MTTTQTVRSAFADSYRLLRQMRDDLADGGMIQEWIDMVREELRENRFAEWTDDDCVTWLRDLADACADDGLPPPFDTAVIA